MTRSVSGQRSTTGAADESASSSVTPVAATAGPLLQLGLNCRITPAVVVVVDMKPVADEARAAAATVAVTSVRARPCGGDPRRGDQRGATWGGGLVNGGGWRGTGHALQMAYSVQR